MARQTSYKILLTMKRRKGMSMDEFIDYYEGHHAPFCAQWMKGAERYVRRYITPQNHPETGPARELSYDVITELWYADKMTFDATLAHLTSAIMPDVVIEDEKKLFDRTSFRIATVIECDTDLS